jgi:hypothetical protein
VLRYAANLLQLLINRQSVDASKMLKAAFCIIVASAVAGCAADSFTAGTAHGDAEFRMQGPACYRQAKSNYEAAGASPDPNAALMNIGAALSAKDDAFEQCTLTPGRGQTR